MIMKEKSENCGQLLADDYKAHHGIDRTPPIRRYKLTKRLTLINYVVSLGIKYLFSRRKSYW